jgi:hypothetical protein
MKKIPGLLLLSVCLLFGGCANVHRVKGPGLLESLAQHELNRQNDRDLERNRINPAEHMLNKMQIEEAFAPELK